MSILHFLQKIRWGNACHQVTICYLMEHVNLLYKILKRSCKLFGQQSSKKSQKKKVTYVWMRIWTPQPQHSALVHVLSKCFASLYTDYGKKAETEHDSHLSSIKVNLHTVLKLMLKWFPESDPLWASPVCLQASSSFQNSEKLYLSVHIVM